MDNITHTLVGLTLSRTPLERAGRGTTAALIIASNLPDIDVVMALHGGRAAYLADHRAFTHSVFGIVVLAIVTAALVRSWEHRPRRHTSPEPREPLASWTALIGVSLVGTIGHVLLDLATPYGTRLLSPLSGVWYSVDWMPIIDVYFLAILIGGTAAFLLRRERRRGIAAAVILLSLGYYGLRAASHQAALHELGAELAARGIHPCTADADPSQAALLALYRWPSSAPSGENGSVAAGESSDCLLEAAAIPTFLSPFVWRMVERYPDAYELTDLDVRPFGFPGGSSPGTLQDIRFPDSHAPAVARAAQAPDARVFLHFARFPMAHVEEAGGRTAVSWTDARFLGGITRLVPAHPQTSPFRLTVTLDPRGDILSASFGQ
ncbi:MAG TPA: metal-dependent hydrolase [Vicinamibacterales bacterium]